MNVEKKRLQLIRRRETLNSEIIDIREEVVVLLALIKKAEKEIESIQAELDELNGLKRSKLAYAN